MEQKVGHYLSPGAYLDDLDPWMTLTLNIEFSNKNFNIGVNFLISKHVYFIFGHNIPLDITFHQAHSLMTLKTPG
jgi:hypothetical protein